MKVVHLGSQLSVPLRWPQLLPSPGRHCKRTTLRYQIQERDQIGFQKEFRCHQMPTIAIKQLKICMVGPHPQDAHRRDDKTANLIRQQNILDQLASVNIYIMTPTVEGSDQVSMQNWMLSPPPQTPTPAPWIFPINRSVLYLRCN